MTLAVPDKPFKSPKTDNQRDNELGMERLNAKIKDSVSDIIVQANADIEGLRTDLEGDISTLTVTVTTNATNITTNTTNIGSLNTNISTNTTAILTKVNKNAALAAIVLPEGVQDGIVIDSSDPNGVIDSNVLTDDAWNKSTGSRPKGWHGQFTDKFQAVYDNQVALRDKINAIVTIING